MNKTATKIKNRQTANDVFYTPETVVSIHLDIVSPYIVAGMTVFDPFYGRGAYFEKMVKRWQDCCFTFTEIEMGMDFFAFDNPVDAIISNPPYSKMDAVLQKSVDLRPKIISFLIGLHNLTPKRIEFMNDHGYQLVKLHIMKVYKWFGMSAIVLFNKEGESCISYDRHVHR